MSSCAEPLGISLPASLSQDYTDIPISLDPVLIHKWQTYTFFCHAFGFHPLWSNHENAENTFDFTLDGLAQEKGRNLKDLRSQLKLEKIRWHEGKMKALCGEEVIGDERVKAAWSALIDMKGRVDEELGKTLGVI